MSFQKEKVRKVSHVVLAGSLPYSLLFLSSFSLQHNRKNPSRSSTKFLGSKWCAIENIPRWSLLGWHEMHEGIKIQLQESLQSGYQVRPDARFHHFSWTIWWGQVCGASSRAMNLRRKGVNHLTHQEKQTSRWWWWQWWRHAVQDESLCLLDEFLQLVERMERISSEALVTDDSPKFQCHAMWLNRGAKELFFSNPNKRTRRWRSGAKERSSPVRGRDLFLPLSWRHVPNQ